MDWMPDRADNRNRLVFASIRLGDVEKEKQGGRRDGVPLDCHWLCRAQRWISVSQSWLKGTQSLAEATYFTQLNIFSIEKGEKGKKANMQREKKEIQKGGDELVGDGKRLHS